MALPRERRLRRSSDINRVYARGSRGHAKALFVRALGNNQPDSRVVVVVGKKVSKKAVVRNKIRRQLTEQLAKLWNQLGAGQDIVIYVKEDLSSAASEAERELKSALERAGVLGSSAKDGKAK